MLGVAIVLLPSSADRNVCAHRDPVHTSLFLPLLSFSCPALKWILDGYRLFELHLNYTASAATLSTPCQNSPFAYTTYHGLSVFPSVVWFKFFSNRAILIDQGRSSTQLALQVADTDIRVLTRSYFNSRDF